MMYFEMEGLRRWEVLNGECLEYYHATQFLLLDVIRTTVMCHTNTVVIMCCVLPL